MNTILGKINMRVVYYDEGTRCEQEQERWAKSANKVTQGTFEQTLSTRRVKKKNKSSNSNQ